MKKARAQRQISAWSGALALALALLLQGVDARADVSSVAWTEAMQDLPDGGARLLRLAQGQARATALVVGNPGRGVRVSRSWWVVPMPPATSLSQARQSGAAHFSPARGAWMDRVVRTTGQAEAARTTGLSGAGTVVGVVDTGVDLSHPAFRNPDGSTRVRWFLDYGSPPRGVHEALEEEFGCVELDPCAVWNEDDINSVLESRVLAGLPQDRIGHGTHITSLAAGSGDDYPGMAPAAEIIVVGAANEFGGVTDGRILLGTKFVFDRAAELDLPAVVNVSLGSSFGAHDGRSAVERGLAELAEGAGRAIVVAAGNSGLLYEGLNDELPEPFGIFTEVSVTKQALVRVPILNVPGSATDTEGAVFLWINGFEGNSLDLAFETPDGPTSFASVGDAGGVSSSEWDDGDDFDVVIINGRDDDFDLDRNSAVVTIAGTWRAGRTFSVLLRGEGTARMWVTGTGQAGILGGGLGPLLTRARRLGTVAIPGTQPDLITVGATQNRSSWFDYEGNEVGFNEPRRGVASFSSAGPNQLGELKPELVAPGGGVIGAMARAADPRRSLTSSSQFASGGICPTNSECFVVDDEHAVSSGTSMSAPVVAGAVALLMERDPSLTMEQSKELLMAGARRLEGLPSAGGVGELDVVGALLAQDAAQDESPERLTVSREQSWTVWSDDFARPGSSLMGVVITRDTDGNPIDLGPALQLRVEGPGQGVVLSTGLGWARLRLAVDPSSGGQSLTVAVLAEQSVLDRRSFSVALDPIQARVSPVVSGAACSLVPRASKTRTGLFWSLLALALMGAWRRSARVG